MTDRDAPEHHGYTPEAYDEDCENEDGYRQSLTVLAARAALDASDVVLDLGTGTGNVALELAPQCEWVLGRDIDHEWLSHARKKAGERGVTNVDFAYGSVLEPNVDRSVDVVTVGYVLNGLYDDGGETAVRKALDTIVSLTPHRLLVVDYMRFGPHSSRPWSEGFPTMGTLANLLADTGFVLTTVDAITDSVGVLVAAVASD